MPGAVPRPRGGETAISTKTSAAAGLDHCHVGRASSPAHDHAADGWRSTYVTIWRRQPDGAWKVLFDTGRIVQGS